METQLCRAAGGHEELACVSAPVTTPPLPASQLPDGLTLFRFAHMTRHPTSGGIEAYLWQLNRTMLQRSRIRILQMYLTTDFHDRNVSVARIGHGDLIWIPSLVSGISAEQLPFGARCRMKLGLPTAEALNVDHRLLLSTLSEYRPDLAIFHWLSEDSEQVLETLLENGVPVAAVNHFDNARLNAPGPKQQLRRMRTIAAVTNIDIPSYLRGRVAELSDGIDTGFFRVEIARRVPVAHHVVLLPARVCEIKGHLDAVKAVALVLRRLPQTTLVFVGRAPSNAFAQQLACLIDRARLRDHVIFAGEVSAEQLRDWYAAAAVVILPSYTEGLPRVLLEAQSMERPVLAYDVGGVRRSFCDGVGGFLVKPGDVIGLSQRLDELLDDPDRRRAIGAKGRCYILENFSLDRLAERHERFCRSALQ